MASKHDAIRAYMLKHGINPDELLTKEEDMGTTNGTVTYADVLAPGLAQSFNTAYTTTAGMAQDTMAFGNAVGKTSAAMAQAWQTAMGGNMATTSTTTTGPYQHVQYGQGIKIKTKKLNALDQAIEDAVNNIKGL